jgi:hypothetical protein
MAPLHARDVPQISPAQVWAQVAAEQQHQIIRLLAHLAVQVIGAETPSPGRPGIQKETADVHPPRSIQNPAGSS